MRGEYKILLGSALFALIPVATLLGSSCGNIILLTGRLSIATLILFLFDQQKKSLFKISVYQWLHLLLFALLMLAAMLLYFLAIPLIGMAKASALLGVQPALLLILGRLFFQEKMTLFNSIVCLVCLIGILLITKTEEGMHTNSLTGIAFTLTAAFCLSLIFLLQKKFLSEFSGTRLVFYQCIFQLPFIAPLILFIPHPVLDARGIYAILLLGIFCTAIAYAFIYNGSKTVGMGKIGILQSVEYVLPALIGFMFFQENITLYTLTGIGCILVSCWLTLTTAERFKNRNRHSLHRIFFRNRQGGHGLYL